MDDRVTAVERLEEEMRGIFERHAGGADGLSIDKLAGLLEAMGLLAGLDGPRRAVAVAARMAALDDNQDGRIVWEEFKHHYNSLKDAQRGAKAVATAGAWACARHGPGAHDAFLVFRGASEGLPAEAAATAIEAGAGGSRVFTSKACLRPGEGPETALAAGLNSALCAALLLSPQALRDATRAAVAAASRPATPLEAAATGGRGARPAEKFLSELTAALARADGGAPGALLPLLVGHEAATPASAAAFAAGGFAEALAAITTHADGAMKPTLAAVAGLAAKAGLPVDPARPAQIASAVHDCLLRLNASAMLAAFDAVVAPGAPDAIGSAIEAAAPGARIFLRPGRYNEMLSIDKDVHLVGNRAAVLKWTGATTITVSAANASLDGLVVRNRGGDYALDIQAGDAQVRNCDISAEPAWSTVAVQIAGQAACNPLIANCRVHSGAKAGIWFFFGCEGRMEECDIYDNGEDGVKISTGSQPTIARCRIFNNKQSGIYAYNDGSGGHLSDSHIWSNDHEQPIRLASGADFLSQTSVSLEPPRQAEAGGSMPPGAANFGPAAAAAAG